MSRDSQRSKVYSCDRVLMEWCRFHGQLVNFETLEEIQAFVDKVHRWAYRQPLRPYHVRTTPPTVKASRSGNISHAHGSRWHVAFAKNKSYHYTNVLAIHELAHLYNAEYGHGRNYCRKYLALVKKFISREAGAALRQAFVKRAVKHRKKPIGRRRLTAEQREIQIQRLAAHRFGQ